MGKDVIVVLLFWTIRKLAQGRIDEVDFPPEYEGAADQVRRLLKERNAPSVSVGCSTKPERWVTSGLVACSAGLEYMGVASDAVTKRVDDVMGLPATWH